MPASTVLRPTWSSQANGVLDQSTTSDPHHEAEELNTGSQVKVHVFVSPQIATVTSSLLTHAHNKATTASVFQKNLEEVFPLQGSVFYSEDVYLTFLRGGEVMAGKYEAVVNNARRNTGGGET